ncbi:MAG: rRNA maturation RNase YbeY [Parcubacteria group bacterium]|jgi:probable rRNA maturation factor
MEIEVANKTRKRISKLLVQKAVRKTLDVSKSNRENFSVSVAFVEKSEIRRLNRIYRKKNKPTDTLSFSYDSGYNKRKRVYSGELVLCPEIISKQAKENKVAFQKELVFVLSHGVLHLLGMKHGKKMYEVQDRISSLKFKEYN